MHVAPQISTPANCGRSRADYGKAQHIRDFGERTAAIDAAHDQVKRAVSDLAAVGNLFDPAAHLCVATPLLKVAKEAVHRAPPT